MLDGHDLLLGEQVFVAADEELHALALCIVEDGGDEALLEADDVLIDEEDTLLVPVVLLLRVE